MNIVLDERDKTLNITFSDSRTSKMQFNDTVEKIIRLGVQVGQDPRYNTICLKSDSPKMFKYISEFLLKKFKNFRQRLSGKVQETKGDLVEVKCIYNEIEVMKFRFDVSAAHFQW
ncbi:MAG: hypothetical protein H7Y04_07250 [Verrucomicrobia bacterium]|nr:hypothetical protein [Cytophagales bacterium]